MMSNTTKMIQLNSIEDALDAFKSGQVIIVVDDEDRENEGDFICAAETVTPEIINFMATHGRGLICAPIDEHRADELGLDLMVNRNTALHETAFTVSVDLIGHGCSTGISAYDRATGIRALTNPAFTGDDFARPGHIFPLRAKTGGVLRRTGHTEAAIDLARLSGFFPAGVLVEILNEDGTMARLPQLIAIAEKFSLKIISIADLVAYRLEREKLILREYTTTHLSPIGMLTFTAYSQITTGDLHLAIRYGHWEDNDIVPVRVQSALSYAEINQILDPSQSDIFNYILEIFRKQDKGLLVIMHHQDKQLNLIEKLQQLSGLDASLTNKMDRRDYGVGAQIIRDQRITRLALLSDSPIKRIGLEGYGLEMVSFIPIKQETNN
ncbi:MAG: 3,4-dihydroxy-2-butanone-4-phosphate synthase [Saprospiraceae bacterium]|nr:3,4-dihydroxy-2-butanone-4-phosphate synthase [Saprospiraceae bacterium]